MSKKRNVAFDLLKLFGALMIAVLHYNWRFAPQAYLIVEMFFMITGFLLDQKKEHYRTCRLTDTILKKTFHLYLYYFTLVVCTLLFFPSVITSMDQLLNALLMLSYFFPAEGTLLLPYAQLWYIPVYLLSYLFFILLMKLCSQNTTLYYGLILFLTYASLMNMRQYDLSINRTFEAYLGLFPFGLYRAIAGTGLGILLHRFLSIHPLRLFEGKKNILFMLLCLFALSGIYTREVTVAYDYLNYALLALLIGSASRVTIQTPILSRIASLSTPIYMVHTLVILSLKKYPSWSFDRRLPLLLYLLLVLFLAVSASKLHAMACRLAKKAAPLLGGGGGVGPISPSCRLLIKAY